MRELLRIYVDRLVGRDGPEPALLASQRVECDGGMDPRELRNAMGHFATGVTVVTTMAGQSPVGVTANSFTSVSLDPPLVLFCLGKSLGCADVFEAADHYTINVLRSDQQAVSNRFATKGIDRFEDTDWRLSGTGVPVIEHALANIECRAHAKFDGGDHTIFIGEVMRAQYVPGQDPLLYFGGTYRELNQV